MLSSCYMSEDSLTVKKLRVALYRYANTQSFSFSILTSWIMTTLLYKICNLYSKEVIIRQNPSTQHTSRIAKKPGSISPCSKLLLTLCRITISNDYPYSKLEQSARTIWAMSCLNLPLRILAIHDVWPDISHFDSNLRILPIVGQ